MNVQKRCLKGPFSITPVCFREPRIELSKHCVVLCRSIEHKVFANAVLVSKLVGPVKRGVPVSCSAGPFVPPGEVTEKCDSSGTTKRLFRIARDSALSANMFARHIYDCRLRLPWMRVERVPRVLSESSHGMKRFWKSAYAIRAKPGCLRLSPRQADAALEVLKARV